MKIKTKLVLAFWGIAILSIFVPSYIVINTIKHRYEKVEKEKVERSESQAEIFFYEQLSDIKKRIAILSSMKNLFEGNREKDELYLKIHPISFLIERMNLREFNRNFKLVFSLKNSLSRFVDIKTLEKIIKPKSEKEAYLRRANIYFINGGIYFIAIAPILDSRTIEIKGFLLLEKKITPGFPFFLKDRIKSDIIIISKNGEIFSTIIEDVSNKDYLSMLKLPTNTVMVKLGRKLYFTKSFFIKDYTGERIGRIFVLNDIDPMIFAQRVFIRKFLYVLILLTIFFTSFGLFLANKMSSPILELSKATEEVSRGNYNVKVKKTSSDEIGKLTDFFNQMVVSLNLQRSELLSLQRFFENIIKNLIVALIICDENLRINMVNNEAKRIFNISSDVLNKDLFETVPFIQNFIGDIIKLPFEGVPKYYESVEYSDGKEKSKILRIMFYRIILEGSEYLVIQAEDITKRIRIEEKLVQANKLISIGELLSRFTHENHNIISGILGNLEVLKMKVKDNEDILEKILKVEKLVKKSLELSDGILDFSKKKKIIMEKILLREVIDEVVGLLKASVLKNIRVERKYPEELFHIRANKEKISVIIMNLLINAKDAIEEAKREMGEVKIILESVSIRESEYLMLRIKDNGIGIESEKLDKIFDSYYTTKGESGTGLGLANVKDIVDDMGGFIEVRSELGRGTEFEIYFPLF